MLPLTAIKQPLTPTELAEIRAFQSTEAGMKLEWALRTGEPSQEGSAVEYAHRLQGWKQCVELYVEIANKPAPKPRDTVGTL